MQTNFIDIGSFKIGHSEPCFIIAEAGVNHNGDPALARQLVDAARDAGANAVKFQTWITEKLITSQAPMAAYQRENMGAEDTQYSMLKRLELSQQQFREIQAYALRQGILFLSTPDEEDSADFLDSLGVPAIKIGSAEVTNLPYLGYIAAKGKPVILSTGMATLGEVEAAVQAIEETQNHALVLLHCVSDYPASPQDCNLLAMDTLRQAFQYPVGFSDHTLGTEVAIAAVARGACVIEKHLTLDKGMPGPDHSSSLDPQEFAQMVRAIRTVETALGTGRKTPTPPEMQTRLVVRKSIVAQRDIPQGTTLQRGDLALRRSSGGLPAANLGLVIGRVTKRDLQANDIISWDDIG